MEKKQETEKKRGKNIILTWQDDTGFLNSWTIFPILVPFQILLQLPGQPSKTEHFVIIVYFHKTLHLGCWSSPRTASAYGKCAESLVRRNLKKEQSWIKHVDFFRFRHSFRSSQLKWNLVLITIDEVYELPYELPNNLICKILEN